MASIATHLIVLGLVALGTGSESLHVGSSITGSLLLGLTSSLGPGSGTGSLLLL